MRKYLRHGALIAATTACLALAPGLALAAAPGSTTGHEGSNGVTSGPASNSNVVPGTAAAKQGNAGQESTAQLDTSGKAATGVGAPGTPAKTGTELGEAPKSKSAQ